MSKEETREIKTVDLFNYILHRMDRLDKEIRITRWQMLAVMVCMAVLAWLL